MYWNLKMKFSVKHIYFSSHIGLMRTTMKLRHVYLLFVFIISASMSSWAMSATLTSTVDRTSLSIDETLRLSITLSDTGTRGSPNLDLLNTDFDVLSSNQSSMVRTYNGRVTTSTEWTITLGPKHTGKLIIPSFNIDGIISDALEVTVTASKPLAHGQQKDISIETIVNKDSVYVQEQMKLTHRLIFDSSINIDQLDAEPVELDNAVIEKLPDTKYQKNINGKIYYVFEYNYAIFPQSSGEIVIPSLRWNLRIAKSNRRSFFNNIGNYELKRQRTDEKKITVRPKPVIFPADKPWLPAEKMIIQENWSQDPSSFKLGEPLTRTIIVQANGLTSSQLPKFTNEPNTTDIKFYADQPVLKDEQREDGVVSQRIESAAIVAAKAGDLTIPGEEIPWWNTETDRLEFLHIEPRIISVTGSANNINQTLENAQNANTIVTDKQIAENEQAMQTHKKALLFWQFLSAFFAVLAAIFAYIAFFVRPAAMTHNAKQQNTQQKHRDATETQAWNALSNTLTNNNATQARQHLIVWLGIQQNRTLNSIDEAINHISSAELTLALRKFDESLYGNSNSQEDTQQLLVQLSEYRKQQSKKGKSSNDDASLLADLHPTKA